MIIKKVGHIVIFKSQLHRLIYRLSFLIMLLSPFLVLLFPQLKEEHRSFQQPSLHTNILKMPDIEQSEEKHNKTTVIPGIIHDECLLVTFGKPTNITFVQNFIKVVKSYKKSNIFVKNVVVLTYDSLEQLQNWLIKQKHGVIRAAINLQISQNSSLVLYKLYGMNGRQSDQDYYYAVRELLDGLNIRHRPCQAKTQSLRNILDYLTNLSQLPFSTLSQYLHYQICSATAQQSAHTVLMKHGIQAATLDAVKSKKYTNITSSLHRLILSWVVQFQLQQDHLHSSNTLYHPFNKNHDLSVKFFMIPNLVFLIGLGVYLLTKTIKMGVPTVQPEDIIFVGLALSSLIISQWLLIALPFCGLSRSKEKKKKYKHMLCYVNVMLAVYQMIYYSAWTPLTLLCCLLILVDRRVAVVVVGCCGGLMYWYGWWTKVNMGMVGLIPLFTAILH